MTPRLWRASIAGLAIAALIVACGARTGLLVPDESTLADAEAQQALAECTTPPYCVSDDLRNVYRCGRVATPCGLLEQCEERGGSAECVNPCVDSLGNDTSNGCDFYAVEMDTTPEAVGVCYAVFVVNQWKTGEPARLQVSLGGRALPVEQFARIPTGTGASIAYGPYDANAGLPANQVAILFLSRDPNHTGDPMPSIDDPAVIANCPPGVTPAIVGDAAFHGTGTGSAFHLQTNVPVVAYQMLPYGGGEARVTGATLLLPTSAWDTNYVVADAYKAPDPRLIPSARAGPSTVIVASQDDTMVTIKSPAAIVGSEVVPGTPAGVPIVYSLNQGQYLQFTQREELTGSAVQADKPVGILGGSTSMDIPITTKRADHGEQMLPPVRALGSEYVAVRYRNRGATEETVPWRIVGVVDGTVLTYDPPQPTALRSIGAQQLAEFDAPGPFVVRSQDANHPFYVASYMTGGCGTPATTTGLGPPDCPADDGPLKGFGDPEFLNVVPPAQYLPRYTFFTDPTYPETNLVIVRVRDAQTGEMPDVTLDCAGVLGGWQPVGTGGIYEMTRTDLSTGDFQGVGMCNNGVHALTGSFVRTTGAIAPTPFVGVTIWGWGNDATWPTDTTADEMNPKFTRWVSYGYPAGANFKPLNTTVLPAR